MALVLTILGGDPKGAPPASPSLITQDGSQLPTQALQTASGTTSLIAPLARTRWIDGGAVTPAGATADGSIELPLLSNTAFFTLIGNNASVADANQQFLALVSPSTVAAYTENPTIPAYRNVTVRMLAGLFPGGTLTGNWTWNNTAAAGGVNAGTTSSFTLQDGNITGNFTYTDDAGAPAATTLVFSNDAVPSQSIQGSLIATGGTKLATIAFLNTAVLTNVTSTANATGAIISATNASFTGAVTAKSGTFTQCTFNGGGSNVLTFNPGSTTTFIDCAFTGGSIAAGAGSTLSFDSQSWRSFQEANGTITSGTVLVVGGYLAGDNPGANITATTPLNFSLNGTGASVGFTAGGNHYTIPGATLAAASVGKLLTGGGEKKGDTLLITRADVTANTYTIQDDTGATIGVLPVSTRGFFLATFNGTHWVQTMSGSGS